MDHIRLPLLTMYHIVPNTKSRLMPLVGLNQAQSRGMWKMLGKVKPGTNTVSPKPSASAMENTPHCTNFNKIRDCPNPQYHENGVEASSIGRLGLTSNPKQKFDLQQVESKFKLQTEARSQQKKMDIRTKYKEGRDVNLQKSFSKDLDTNSDRALLQKVKGEGVYFPPEAPNTCMDVIPYKPAEEVISNPWDFTRGDTVFNSNSPQLSRTAAKNAMVSEKSVNDTGMASKIAQLGTKTNVLPTDNTTFIASQTGVEEVIINPTPVITPVTGIMAAPITLVETNNSTGEIGNTAITVSKSGEKLNLIPPFDHIFIASAPRIKNGENLGSVVVAKSTISTPGGQFVKGNSETYDSTLFAIKLSQGLRFGGKLMLKNNTIPLDLQDSTSTSQMLSMANNDYYQIRQKSLSKGDRVKYTKELVERGAEILNSKPSIKAISSETQNIKAFIGTQTWQEQSKAYGMVQEIYRHSQDVVVRGHKSLNNGDFNALGFAQKDQELGTNTLYHYIGTTARPKKPVIDDEGAFIKNLKLVEEGNHMLASKLLINGVILKEHMLKGQNPNDVIAIMGSSPDGLQAYNIKCTADSAWVAYNLSTNQGGIIPFDVKYAFRDLKKVQPVAIKYEMEHESALKNLFLGTILAVNNHNASAADKQGMMVQAKNIETSTPLGKTTVWVKDLLEEGVLVPNQGPLQNLVSSGELLVPVMVPGNTNPLPNAKYNFTIVKNGLTSQLQTNLDRITKDQLGFDPSDLPESDKLAVSAHVWETGMNQSLAFHQQTQEITGSNGNSFPAGVLKFLKEYKDYHDN